MDFRNKRVAIIHYWLVTMRGGEKVLEELCRMFPDAVIFTHVYDPDAVSETIRRHEVRTTFINRLPRAKHWYQNYLPLMPRALAELDLRGFDLVISSESGPAKGVVVDPDAFHLCYCHSPMRYVWDMYYDYLESLSPLKRLVFRHVTPALRRYDRDSAMSVDRFVANSSFITRRIGKIYRRTADVVHPPVDIEPFLAVDRKPEDFYLFLGQLVDYKRVDLAIGATRVADRRLIVIGDGVLPLGKKPHVTHLKHQSFESVLDHLSRARALLFPGTEDFGIVPVEAAAAGCPVIAYRRGGALETVEDGVTGIFFDEQTPECLAAAISRLEGLECLQTGNGGSENRTVFSTQAQRFTAEAFRRGIIAALDSGQDLTGDTQ